MYVTPPPEMTAGEVLSAFHRDAPYLFLGAAFVAVGLVSAAFATIRRKHDSLLVYFALFAVLYGLRLWIQSEPDVPEGDWYKDFGSFKIRGEGKLPKTFLLKGQAARGKPI